MVNSDSEEFYSMIVPNRVIMEIPPEQPHAYYQTHNTETETEIL